LGLGILPPLKGLYKSDENEPSIDAILVNEESKRKYLALATSVNMK
jgi:hypothetical protein